MSKGGERRGDCGNTPSAGWVSDDALLLLEERLRDWTEYDEASYFLGKAMGVIRPSASYGEVKHLFFGGGHAAEGVKLLDVLIFLVDQGFLESRDNNFEFRWQRAGVTAGLVGA